MTASEEAWPDERLSMILPIVTLLVVVTELPRQPMANEVRSHRLGPPLLVALLAAGPVQAQIVTDGSVGPKVSLSGGQIEIGVNLGSRRGDNLFHSFEKFGIVSGQTATFTGPAGLCHDFSPLPARSIAYSQILTRFLRSQTIEYKEFFPKVTQSSRSASKYD
jgi:hypothetical protein